MKFEVKKKHTHHLQFQLSMCVFKRVEYKALLLLDVNRSKTPVVTAKLKSIKKSKATRVLNLKEESQKKQSPTYLLWYGSSKTSITSKLQCLNHLEIPMGVTFASLNLEEIVGSII